MPQHQKAPLGAPCWIDLFTSDPDRSRAFYGALFGWHAEDPNPEFGGYWNFDKGGLRVAGGMRNDGSRGMPDVWNVYLATDDAKATVDAAVAHGGQVIVPAMDVGELGTMAVVTDAGGAAIGMWQPGAKGLHDGFEVYGEPNTPGWFELHTRDYDKTVDFYRAVFRWDAHTMSDTPEFKYTRFGDGDNARAGIMDSTAFLPDGVPAHWQIYFAVDDTDAALAQTVELGGAIVQEAKDTPFGRLAAATDSTGAPFKLRG